MVLFILFPGGNTSPKEWNDNEAKFLSQLEKIGNVWIHENKFNNSCHYNLKKDNHLDYPGDIDFELDYLHPDRHAEMVHDDVKKHGKYFIPVAFSAGSILARTFAKNYKKECLFCVLLDAVLTTPGFMKQRLDETNESEKSFARRITSDKLKSLQKKIRDERLTEDARKLIDIEHYAFAKYAIKKLTSELPVPTISFINLNLPDDMKYKSFDNMAKISECEIFKKENGNKYNYRYFINKTHGFFGNKECCEEIINTIKSTLYDYQK